MVSAMLPDGVNLLSFVTGVETENETVLLSSRATDRMPPRSVCSVIKRSSPKLSELLFRPTNSDSAHSHHRLPSQEASHGQHVPTLQRWDAFMLLDLARLQVLSISGLSVDGIRELQEFVQQATRLTQLVIDSQFVDDALLYQVSGLKMLKKLLVKSSGTKVSK
jgi:hypothetical protein